MLNDGIGVEGGLFGEIPGEPRKIVELLTGGGAVVVTVVPGVTLDFGKPALVGGVPGRCPSAPAQRHPVPSPGTGKFGPPRSGNIFVTTHN
jgi:hypothetical protein